MADLIGELCRRCKIGTYGLSGSDDWDLTLHCEACNHVTKRYTGKDAEEFEAELD